MAPNKLLAAGGLALGLLLGLPAVADAAPSSPVPASSGLVLSSPVSSRDVSSTPDSGGGRTEFCIRYGLTKLICWAP